MTKSLTNIEQWIYAIRGQRVILDEILAELYGIETKRLNQQVRRNIKRFPADFMFQLTSKENDSLRSQFATLKKGRGTHRKYLPLAFTEQGIAMLSSVLNTDKAIQVNIEIMRAFVQIRRMASYHHDLAVQIGRLEKKYDSKFKVVFEAIRKLMEPPRKKSRKIGF